MKWRPIALVLAVVVAATLLDTMFGIRVIARGAIVPAIAEGVGVAIACVALWRLVPERRDASPALGVVSLLLIIGIARQGTPVLTSFAYTSFGWATGAVLLLRSVSTPSRDRIEDERRGVPTA